MRAIVYNKSTHEVVTVLKEDVKYITSYVELLRLLTKPRDDNFDDKVRSHVNTGSVVLSYITGEMEISGESIKRKEWIELPDTYATRILYCG